MSVALDKTIIIFCDGACSGNPGPGGWGTLVGLPQGEIRELGGRSPSTTNNQMELTAVIEALKCVASRKEKIFLYTDSTYVIRGITEWIHGWKKRGWKTADGKEVANRELWEKLSAEVSKRGTGHPIFWKYVRGHTGVPGNERTDEIAVAFSKSERITLYQGPLLKYDIALYDLPEGDADKLPALKSRLKEKTQPLGYLSLVGGILAKHKTWKECESRVKGVSGAKFKKIMSADEERKILAEWGI